MFSRNLQISEHSTFIVCGIERGGTSMVSQTLSHLGVFMGAELGATYEDVEFVLSTNAYLLNKSAENEAAFKALIARRDLERRQWGFKVPNVFLAPEIFAWFRSPVLICIFRDSIAIADRVSTASKRERQAALQSTSQLQNTLQEVFLSTSLPAIGLSYEKALIDPRLFVERLASSLHLRPPEASRAAAESGIQPSPEAYLKVSAGADIIGHLEQPQLGDIFGWLLNISNEDQVLSASIVIDGKRAGTVTADLYRPDLTGYCTNHFCHGFRFKVPNKYRDGAEHSVRLEPRKHGTTRIGGQGSIFRVPETFGRLEEFVGNSLRGWMCWPGGRTSDITMQLYVDDALVAETKADFCRDDLEPAGLHGAAGFAFDLAEDRMDGAIHSVRVAVRGDMVWEVADCPRYMRFPVRAPTGPAADNATESPDLVSRPSR
jgi:hypothetical protein